MRRQLGAAGRRLVTGGAGFIGQQLVAQLVSTGSIARWTCARGQLQAGTAWSTCWASGCAWATCATPGRGGRAAHRGPADVVVHVAAQSRGREPAGACGAWQANCGHAGVWRAAAPSGACPCCCAALTRYGTTPLDDLGQPVAVTEDGTVQPVRAARAPPSWPCAPRAWRGCATRSRAAATPSDPGGWLGWCRSPVRSCSPVELCPAWWWGAAAPVGARGRLRRGPARRSAGAGGARSCLRIAGPEVHSVAEVVRLLAAQLGLDAERCSWNGNDRPGQNHRYVVAVRPWPRPGLARHAPPGDPAELQALPQHTPAHSCATARQLREQRQPRRAP